ncbi:MAG: hypothetical protein U9P80_10620 [Thermodesulfobacteriota bacterium]|nr:hypothetical protein [Thermodesulfobacteriota bacterium]
MAFIGEDLFRFQASLEQSGSSLEEFIRDNYVDKWAGDNIYMASAIRTTMVNAAHEYLVRQGLFNMEKVQISPVTDPLAHDVEHVPTVHYKGMPYVVTHSMIYSKFLACFNPRIKGLFVDSPNIRLEIESPQRKQRGKYLIDFSQIDIELRRNRGVGFQAYMDDPQGVNTILKEDMERALAFFERMIIAITSAIADKNENEMKALGIAIKVPKQPFPRFRHDELVKQYGRVDTEAKAGEDLGSQFFWITGLKRENYDLIYPYLRPNGNKTPKSAITSDMIFNYDLCAKALIRETGKYMPSLEILSGAIREWLYEPIIARLIDNRIIPQAPVIEDGNIINIEELGGYGPFLLAASMKDKNGQPFFPDTFGGGLGVERTLYSLLRGPQIEKIDDLTFFGKNPDSYPLFMY